MRALVLLLLLPSGLAAQAVERADVPRRGQLRVTFDPTITVWERQFTPAGRVPIGAALPATVFAEVERRDTPLTFDLGLTDQISFRLTLPLVRTEVRARLPLDAAGVALDSILADTTYDLAPIGDTPRLLRFFAGDAEVATKIRLTRAAGAYAAAVAALVRLPTGHLDTPNDLLDVSSGDHQTDLEARLIQELTVAGHLWLNLSIRAAWQRPGVRMRRVGPSSVLLEPRAALATLNWDPGDYLAVDFAPLLRPNPHFAVGPTLGYFTKQRDRYSFRSPQDSIALAGRLGAPRSAGILDAGTSERRVRLGWAMSYLGPGLEAGVTVEQTVSGAGGAVPATTVFRLLLRTWWKLF
jgi:hypothetical protein